MSVPVLLAVTGAAYEDPLVEVLGRTPALVVVRRCVDLADLLAAAASGTARAALVDAGLRRLDAEAMARLAAARVAVVGLVTPGDEAGERRLRQLGVRAVLAADAGAPAIVEAVHARLGRPDAASNGVGRVPDSGAGEDTGNTGDVGANGRLVAVWGPTGAPGRTTVAVTLAAELARTGLPTLLADADTYGASVGQVLGLLDEAPGLAAAARAANAGGLDVAALARAAREVAPGLRVLTGLSRPDRWPELRPAALSVVWDRARSLAAWTVVDCGFCLEQDEELAYDTAAPRRNGATLATLDAADVVVAVGAADPVGVQRLVRGLPDVRDLAPQAQLRVVVTRVRRGPVGPDPRALLAEALERYAGVRSPVLVPDDPAACDAALRAGRSLTETAPSSPARLVLAGLAAELAALAAPNGSGAAAARGRPGRATGARRRRWRPVRA